MALAPLCGNVQCKVMECHGAAQISRGRTSPLSLLFLFYLSKATAFLPIRQCYQGNERIEIRKRTFWSFYYSSAGNAFWSNTIFFNCKGSFELYQLNLMYSFLREGWNELFWCEMSLFQYSFSSMEMTCRALSTFQTWNTFCKSPKAVTFSVCFQTRSVYFVN